MTSTRSAADASLPSNRRSFLTSFGAASLLSGTALASAAPPPDDPHPDSDLFELEAALAVANIRLRALSERCDETIGDEPMVPENLIWRSSDGIILDPQALEQVRCSDGKMQRTYATEGAVEKLRKEIDEWKALPAQTSRLCGAERKIARAEEIIAGVGAWNAEYRTAETARGYTAVSDAYDAEAAIVADLHQRIASIPAHTAEGVLVKIRAAEGCSLAWIERRHTALLGRPDRRPQETKQLLTLSAMIDAAKLGAPSTTAS